MRARGLIGITVTISLATGCGGGSSSGPKAGSPEAAVAAAVRAYSAAVVSGDGPGGYQLVSARCHKVIDAGAFQEQAAQAKANYAGATITTLTVDDVTASTAHVTYTYANSLIDKSKEPWLKENGAWHWDAC